jgi:uncharacterized protein (DUF433 family)
MNPIKVDPEIMHGTPCFAGTRVPVYLLFDYLDEGYSINEFLDNYPTVDKAQVLAVLGMARERVVPAERRAAG